MDEGGRRATRSSAEGLGRQGSVDALRIWFRFVRLHRRTSAAIARERRSHALHLTGQGRELAQAGIRAQRDYVARTLGRLTGADLAALDRLVGVWRDEARRDEAA